MYLKVKIDGLPIPKSRYISKGSRMNQYVGMVSRLFFNQVLNLDRLSSAVEAHRLLWVQSRLAWCHLWCLAWCHLESGKPKGGMGGVKDLPKEKKSALLMQIFYHYFIFFLWCGGFWGYAAVFFCIECSWPISCSQDVEMISDLILFRIFPKSKYRIVSLLCI